jgi:nucleoside-diphosphate-sugar epimerase
VSAVKVLVTGATGPIGKVVVADLLQRGYDVRAAISEVSPKVDRSADERGPLEWRYFDFLQDTDFEALVAGCDAVIHIDAEAANMENMRRFNVGATRRLAEAAEAMGVKAFCYKSSIAVYGSGRTRRMTEDAPVLTVDRDVPSEYWAADYMRAYARTKLAGEIALRQTAKAARYVMLRCAVAVSPPEIIGIRAWSRIKRTLAAHRHAHHIYVLDASEAFIWAMERAFAQTGAPGSVELFNLSEDEFPEPTHADFMRKAFSASGDPNFRVVSVPWIADWLQDFLKYRQLPLRNPMWRMRFPNDRLVAAGYRFRFGMAQAHATALDTLRNEAKRTSAS